MTLLSAAPPSLLSFDSPAHATTTKADDAGYAAFPLWRRLIAAVESPQVSAVSFDCFDTLLFRDVPHPTDLFPRIGARLLAARVLPSWLSPARFKAIRIAAEAEARRLQHTRTGTHEVTLADIYAAFPDNALGANRRNEAAALELAVERESLRPFPPMVELARRIRALGKPLTVTSDTYFPPDWLNATLAETIGLVPDLLLCSSIHRRGKAEGLHTLLPAHLNLRPETILHIGDNYEADVVAAHRAGLQGFHVCHGTSELWQAFAQEHRCVHVDPTEAFDLEQGDLGVQSVRAKCAALAIDMPSSGFWLFGATVFGPAMTMFGEWLGARVRAFEADALLCVMREGPFLGRLAQHHLDAAGIPLVDVWLSRRVLRYASLVTLDPETLRGLCAQLHSPTLRQVCDDLGIGPDELPPDIGHGIGDKLDYGQVGNVLARVTATPALAQAILTRAARLRQAVVAHLFRQLGDVGRQNERGIGRGEPTRRALRLAIVDVGWQGQIQRMLSDILAAENIAAEVAGFYVGTNSSASGMGLLAQRMEGFLFDFGRPALPWRQLTRAVEILEQSLSCESGSTITLSQDGRPLVAPDLIPHTQRGQIRQLQDGIRTFQALWRASGGQVRDPSAPWVADIVRRPLLRALTQPTEAEAAMLAAWHHDDNLVDSQTDTLLPDRARSHARHMSVRQILDIPSTQAYWSHGLAAQASSQARALVRAALNGVADPTEFERPLGQTATLSWSRDGGYGPGISCALVANHEGRVYVRLATGKHADGDLRFLRFEPTNAPAFIQIDFLELTVHFAESCPSARVTVRHADLRACPRSGVWLMDGGGLITTAQPRIHIDLRALGVWGVTAVDLHAGLTVTPLTAGGGQPSWLPPDTLTAFPPAILAGKTLCTGTGSTDEVRGATDTPGRKQVEVVCGSTKLLTVAGWTAETDGTVHRRGAFLMLRRADGATYYTPATRTQRPDVAQVLENHEAMFAGTEAVFSPAPLPPGSYALVWVQVDDDAGSEFETEVTLLVR